MKLRDLKRQMGKTSCHVWPPLWSSSYGAHSRFATGDEGVLKGVQRWDDHLALTMMYDAPEPRLPKKYPRSIPSGLPRSSTGTIYAPKVRPK